MRKDLKKYNKLNTYRNFSYQWKYRYPCLSDRFNEAGTLGAYYWQDLWAATKIIKTNPTEHYDIGSRIDGFIAHLQAANQKTILFDIRPLKIKIPNVEFIQTDATKLENIKDESIESLSSLCALEHFGLGRYGDDVDPDGCFKAFNAIQRVVKKGGVAYISVPIGKEHLEFNAHRIFYAQTIVDCFNKMQLLEFSVNKMDDTGICQINDLHRFDEEDNNHGQRFGLFMFKKI
jgi:hypothetical protein